MPFMVEGVLTFAFKKPFQIGLIDILVPGSAAPLKMFQHPSEPIFYINLISIVHSLFSVQTFISKAGAGPCP